MKKSVLHAQQQALGAKFVNFAGWEMPLYYTGIVAEHQSVRNHMGVFDVSHMGLISIEGPETADFLDFLSTNHIAGKPDRSVTYTVWCDESGGCVEDLLVFQKDSSHFFVIVNASNREKDLAHLNRQAVDFDVKVQDPFEEMGILALQGPEAVEVAAHCFPGFELASLLPMHFAVGEKEMVSRTGYTGEEGFEIVAPLASLPSLWEALLQSGATPAGLGARDTLRLEMGYALYGHELTESIFPTESVAAWTVKLAKDRFLGKEALIKRSPERHEQGLQLLVPGVPRQGCKVYRDHQMIGHITSGTFSPSLNRGIAISLVDVPLQEGEEVDIEVRSQRLKAEGVSLPFLKKKGIK